MMQSTWHWDVSVTLCTHYVRLWVCTNLQKQQRFLLVQQRTTPAAISFRIPISRLSRLHISMNIGGCINGSRDAAQTQWNWTSNACWEFQTQGASRFKAAWKVMERMNRISISRDWQLCRNQYDSCGQQKKFTSLQGSWTSTSGHIKDHTTPSSMSEWNAILATRVLRRWIMW